jgi:acyl-CoA synthetase (AMP-forming)/AMP-acid ligase II
MGRPIFTSWIDHPRARAASSQRGVNFHGDFASWAEIRRRATERAAELRPGMAYVADSRAGIQGMVSMLAIAMTPDTALIWAKVDDVPFPIQPLAPGLYQLSEQPSRQLKRPMYGTLTSGSSGTPKLPMAYGDILELIALHYDEVLYQPTFPGHPEVDVLATCLPLEYAASFMMLVVPAMFMCRDLVVFPPHEWSALHTVAAREHVACLVVPSLMAAASAGTPDQVDMSKTALIMASGYLSRERVAATREKFRGVSILNCYGASETGVVTLDRSPDGSFHVGRPIFGKAVWLEEVDNHGIGKVTTTGIDCREFYWGQEDSLRRADGSLAATDFGHFDDAGNLYLDGRIDGAEKLQGVTIYPRQIERHLLMLPGVVDVRVRVTTSNGVEYLEARVVGSVSEPRVREHCSTLPELSRPTAVECHAEGTTPYSERGKL